MARIRSIKPEFFTDEDLGQLPPTTRLLFIGMWTEADKSGRLKDRPKTLKARCLPFDNVKVETALKELEEARFIIRYQVAKERYIQIRTWDIHQRPHHTEAASKLPAIGNGDLTVNEPLVNEVVRVVVEGLAPLDNGEKKDAPSLPFLSFPFPSSLEGSIEFKDEWESWVKHRKQIKKPLTEEQVKKQLDEFAIWGVTRSIAALKYTIKQGWQGIREPDPPGQVRPKNQPHESTFAERQAERRKLYGDPL